MFPLYLDMFYFFFFKQKTAYEMRISDWSSDVCSSDLAERLSCIAFEHLPELTADNPALLKRNRALYNAFLAGRDDLDGAPLADGITARWRGGDVEPLHALLRSDYATSNVPGRRFELDRKSVV